MPKPDEVSDEELLSDALALGALASLSADDHDGELPATEAARDAAAEIVDKYKT